MEHGLTIRIVDPDVDYLGIEIHAANDRFSGSTRIYAGLDELSEFGGQIAGFPASPKDERRYRFGTRDRKFAGGYCELHFYCVDGAGHVAIGVEIEDDPGRYPAGNSALILRVEAAAIDQFADNLRRIEEERLGATVLLLSA